MHLEQLHLCIGQPILTHEEHTQTLKEQWIDRDSFFVIRYTWLLLFDAAARHCHQHVLHYATLPFFQEPDPPAF